MRFPELDSNESVILQAHNVKVKSVVFEALLTNKRLILVDSKKGLVPTQEILLATIDTIDGGENAIRDPILTFSIFSQGDTARQMILTFPQETSGERRRERDDWLKALQAEISSSNNSTAISDVTASDQHSEQNPTISYPSYPRNFSSSFQKKKIDITRPRRNIIESAPAMPRPVETTSLPIGSFCSRCGNRVPPDSVFCNRCGSPIVTSTEQQAVPNAFISTIPVAAPTVVPQVQIPPAPVFGSGGERKERTFEEVIHSIEPLIEDSVPRSSEPAPLVPRQYPAPPPAIDPPAVESQATDAPQAENPTSSPLGEPMPVMAPPSASPQLPPPTTPSPPPKKSKFVVIAILAIVILGAIIGIVILPNLSGITPHGAVITQAITPVPTVIFTPSEPVLSPPSTLKPLTTSTQPPLEVIIPKNGVWVRVTYSGTYGGTYGTPGNQLTVGERNKGDQFYMVSTNNGPVEVSIQKLDGSADELAIEVYKNGELVKHVATQSPKGLIEFQVDLKPNPTPTPVPSQTVSPTITTTGTAVPNSTVNVTGTI